MTTDDLSAPLGQKPTRKRRLRLPFSALQAVAALLGLCLLTFLGFALFKDDPFGGEPVARVAIRMPPASEKAATVAAHEPARDDKPVTVIAPAPASGPSRTVTIIDGSSGARRDVVVGAGDGEAAAKSESDAAPALMQGIDAKLLEKSRYGLIPIAAGGAKPVTAYAAASDAERAKAASMPSVSIVIAGLGVGAAKTTDAIMKLPAAVTLAFLPYGSEPGKLVERARAQRHEVLLQLPMEPFDYPDNDPGPQTLLTSLAVDQNLDRLFWHLSRIQGYVGVATLMGGKFVAADAAMQPVMREAARRGLGYLDDGLSPRSVAGALAAGQSMPFARADLSIDAVPTAADIDKALARLEALARDKGVAVGIASALPVSIDRIAAWSRSLESRGVLLTPLTTAMLRPKSS